MLPYLCSMAMAEEGESLGVTAQETVDVTEMGQETSRMGGGRPRTRSAMGLHARWAEDYRHDCQSTRFWLDH